MPDGEFDATRDGVPSGDGTFDPASLGGPGTAPEPDAPRKRKRRSDAGIPNPARAGRAASGAGKKAPSGSVHLDLSAFTGMLVGMSAMLAMKTNIEEFEVAEDEMKAFMGAAQNVARHYSVETTQKTLDWIAFAGIGVQIFGTRAVAISLKLKNKGRANKGGLDTVVPFPGGNMPHDFTSG